MMYDLEPYSDYSMPFDSLGIITQQPNKGMIIDSQVLGIIAPEALRDEVFQDVGQTFTYCVSSESAK